MESYINDGIVKVTTNSTGDSYGDYSGLGAGDDKGAPAASVPSVEAAIGRDTFGKA
jgi:hypothetical protein